MTDRKRAHRRGAYLLGIGLAAVLLICGSSEAARAATSGYTVRKIAVPKSVRRQPLDRPGKPFKVTVKGSAKQESGLEVYLDYRKCPASASKEAKRDSIYTAGYSFFIGPSSVRVAAVKGSFKRSFSAHPGSKTGLRYVCVYITTTKSPTTTRAFRIATYRVTAVRPANTAEPVISGTVASGDTLRVTTGSWSNNPTSYSYQWQDCAGDGMDCSDIRGATNSTYAVGSSDAGHTIKAAVTATNGGGSTKADAPIVPLVDNFNGSSIDTNVWRVLNEQGDTSNSEIECYLTAQTAESGGDLTETATYDGLGFTCPSGTPNSTNPLTYESGAVQMKSVAFTYGKVKVRAKMAGPAGTTWPAIWLLGATCQTSSTSPFTFLSGTSGTQTGYYCPWSSDSSDAAEIDIAEWIDDAPTAMNETLWNDGVVSLTGGGGCAGGLVGHVTGLSDVTANYHTYELDWSAGSLTWKIDGRTECSTTTSVPSHPMFLIIDTAICSSGSSCGGSPVSSDLPSTTSVRYVEISH